MWSSGRPPATDEEVLADQRPHPVFCLGPAALVCAALAGAVAIAVTFPSAPVAVAWVLAAMVGVPAAWLAGRLVRWRVIRLVVTSRRVVYRGRLRRRGTVVLPVERIAAARAEQSFGERIIGSGRLLLDVPEGGTFVIGDVRRPKSLVSGLSAQLRRPVAVPGRERWGEGVARQVLDWPEPAAARSGTPAPGTPAPAAAPGTARRAGFTLFDDATRDDTPFDDMSFEDTLLGDPLRDEPPGGAVDAPGDRAFGGLHWSATIPPAPVVWPPGGGLSPPAPAESSVAGRLMQLDDLWRRGVVSDDEYARKKEELLRLL